MKEDQHFHLELFKTSIQNRIIYESPSDTKN